MGDHYAPSPIALSGSSDFTLDPQLTSSNQSLTGQSDFAVTYSGPTLVGSGTFVAEGLQVTEHEAGYHHVAKYVGEPSVPQDVKRMRRSVYELMRRMGTPVIVKKMLTEADTLNGAVEESPNFDDIYGQTRNRDPLSHGTGYVSVETSPREWVNTSTSHIITSETSPGAGFVPAPRYRGYGPGFLTYIIEPDTAEDFFKHTPEGVLIKVQTATAQAPWWPDIDDNDLIIHVTLDQSGFIIGSQQRYQAKMTNPITLRGTRERRGRQEYSADFGSRYVVNQTFEMALLPRQHELYKVEVDR